MKTRTKLLAVLIIVLIVVAVSAISFAVWKENKTYRNQKLVKLVYEYWEIENREIARIGEEATRILLPEMISSAPDLFQGRMFYFDLDNLKKADESIDLMIRSRESRKYQKPFRVNYNVFKPPSDIIQYDWSGFTWDYLGYSGYQRYSYHRRAKSEEEKKIKNESVRILEIAEKNFEGSLLSYRKRKKQEEKFIEESQKVAPKILQANKILRGQIKIIESFTKTSRGYYSFTILSERFKRVTCTFFYDPDPVFKFVRIELAESSIQKDFDIGYRLDYKQDRVLGLINNKDVTLGSFELLSEVLKEIETKITESPEIIMAVLLAKSVK